MRLRKVLFVTFLALAVPVGTASLAYACTALATLTVTSGASAPGQTISGTGKGFNGGLHGADPATATRTPVVMRLDTRSGPILGSFTPNADGSGNIVFSFAAPNIPAGQHVLIGVQNDPATGNPYYGTPARQSVTIAAAAARADASRAEGVSAPVAADQASPAPAVSATPAAPAAAAAASANVAARPTQAAAAPAAGSGAAAASSAPDQAGQAATGAPAAPARGIQPTLASDLGAGSATPAAAAAASAAAAATTTATPDLVSTSSPDGGSSVLPAMLLMLLGLGIGLTASARWLVGRLPMLRRTAAA